MFLKRKSSFRFLMLLPTIASCFFFRFLFLTSHSLVNEAGIHSRLQSAGFFIPHFHYKPTLPLFQSNKVFGCFFFSKAKGDFNVPLMRFRPSSHSEIFLLPTWPATLERLWIYWKWNGNLTVTQQCESWMKCIRQNRANTTEKTFTKRSLGWFLNKLRENWNWNSSVNTQLMCNEWSWNSLYYFYGPFSPLRRLQVFPSPLQLSDSRATEGKYDWMLFTEKRGRDGAKRNAFMNSDVRFFSKERARVCVCHHKCVCMVHVVLLDWTDSFIGVTLSPVTQPN